jgi:hypothetical protein
MAADEQGAYADMKTVKQLAAQMPSEHLQCRKYGHSWKPLEVEELSAADKRKLKAAYAETLKCSVCGTGRSQLLTKKGELRRNSYQYAKGYQTPKGTGRLSGEARDVLRVTDILRRLSLKAH